MELYLYSSCLHGVNSNSSTLYHYQYYVQDPQSTTLYDLFSKTAVYPYAMTVITNLWAMAVIPKYSSRSCSLESLAPSASTLFLVILANVSQTSAICYHSLCWIWCDHIFRSSWCHNTQFFVMFFLINGAKNTTVSMHGNTTFFDIKHGLHTWNSC